MISATGIVCGSTGRLNWSICRFTTFLPRENSTPRRLSPIYMLTLTLTKNPESFMTLLYFTLFKSTLIILLFHFENVILIEIQSIMLWILKKLWFIVVRSIDWLIGKKSWWILPPRMEPGVEAHPTQPISSAWLQFLRLNFFLTSMSKKIRRTMKDFKKRIQKSQHFRIG